MRRSYHEKAIGEGLRWAFRVANAESTFECLEGHSAEASEPEGKEGKRWESRSEVHIWLLRALSSRVVKHSQLFLTFGLSQILTPTARCRLHPYSWGVVSFQPLHTRVYQLFSAVICGKDRRKDKIPSKAAVSGTELLIVFFLPELHSQMR